MAATLRSEVEGVEIEMVPSGGGRFEVTANGTLIYSKLKTGRHPSHEEILAALP